MLVHALAMLWVVIVAESQAQAQTPMFDVTISSPATEFQVGTPIRIDVVIVNHTDQTLMFHLRMTPDLSGMTVRDDHENALAPREEWRKPPQIMHWSGEGVNAHKSVDIPLNIANWFDLSPGQYFVQLAPEGSSLEGPREKQKSNVLGIRIAPK